MNLLELMLKEEVEWPVGALIAMQDYDGQVKWSENHDVFHKPVSIFGVWQRIGNDSVSEYFKNTTQADDWSTRIITREEYQAAGGKMAADAVGFTPFASVEDAATEKNDAPSVDATLTERGNRYGKFKDHAELSQKLKEAMYCADGWECLSADMREALEMIQHKVARILNGDPTYADSWHDIAGYAKLVDDRLNGVER